MKARIVKITLLVVGICLLLSTLIFFLWFFSPGVRIWGRLAHVDIEKTGYIVNPYNMKVTGQTQVTIDGTALDFDNPIQGGDAINDFKGSFSVADFQNTEEGTLTLWGSATRNLNGFYALHYDEEYFRVHDTGSEIGYCHYKYTLFLHPDDPDFLLIKVYDGIKAEHYILCSENENDALLDFQWAMGVWNLH